MKILKNLESSIDLLYSESQIQSEISILAKQMTEDFVDKNPIFICIMMGGMLFFTDLVKRINCDLELDYVHVSRFNKENNLPGDFSWIAEPQIDMTNRTVVVIDDILDRGITLQKIKLYCESKGAKEFHSAVLIDKKHSRSKSGLQEVDYSCFTLTSDVFIFGYGLDYKGVCRNIPNIYHLIN
jgi:hypoxanthine phosphoribosyltransferase